MHVIYLYFLRYTDTKTNQILAAVTMSDRRYRYQKPPTENWPDFEELKRYIVREVSDIIAETEAEATNEEQDRDSQTSSSTSTITSGERVHVLCCEYVWIWILEKLMKHV